MPETPLNVLVAGPDAARIRRTHDSWRTSRFSPVIAGTLEENLDRDALAQSQICEIVQRHGYYCSMFRAPYGWLISYFKPEAVECS